MVTNSSSLMILEGSLLSNKLLKIENLDDILNSSKGKLISFLHECPDPKVWLVVIVSAVKIMSFLTYFFLII